LPLRLPKLRPGRRGELVLALVPAGFIRPAHFHPARRRPPDRRAHGDCRPPVRLAVAPGPFSPPQAALERDRRCVQPGDPGALPRVPAAPPPAGDPAPVRGATAAPTPRLPRSGGTAHPHQGRPLPSPAPRA